MSQTRFALLMAMAVALTPLAIDAYLPAFPAMAAAFGEPIHSIALSLSIYMMALAVGQLVGGPLSDRIGRSRIMLSGMALFATASVMLATAADLDELLLWRAVQAFGGGWTAVCIPAIVRDRVEGREAARLFSLIGLITISAPAVAPSLGSTILLLSEWHGIFLFLAGYAVIALGLLWFGLFAGQPPHYGTPPQNLLASYGLVLRHTGAMRFMLLQALVFSVMLTFLTHASFIYQEWFGLSEYAFSSVFALNIVAMAAVNITNRKLLKSGEPAIILRVAVITQSVSVLVLALVVVFAPALWLFVPVMMVSVGCLGAIGPNSTACCMQFFKQNSGTASAILGALQFALAGGISAASTFVANGSVVRIVLIMLACSLMAAALAWGGPATMRQRGHEAPL